MRVWINRGRTLRKGRSKRRVTCQELADIMGVDVAEIVSTEWGYKAPEYNETDITRASPAVTMTLLEKLREAEGSAVA
jgi:hypothetical protein